MYIRFILILFIIVFNLCFNQIHKITIDNFNSLVINSKKIWVIEYYSEMCGTCQEFYETWDSLTNSFKEVNYGRVNIDENKGMQIAKQEKVLEKGIPAIRLIYGNNINFNIMIGTEEPLPKLNELINRIKEKLLDINKVNIRKMNSELL